ncbi:MAG: SIMPL domain-containing protein [Erythrobacter sp.]|nr:SIMPL domain-containing protein [Erythrobacter sp.]NCQ62633.1 SIMPL domain-containing protein [Alphaproteobacteria bacterium]
MIRTALIPTALAASVLAASPALSADIQVQATGPVIELQVNEQVEVEPDTVKISAGVTNEAMTAQDALSQNSVQMRQVIDRLRTLGIPERDIQTTRINLGARFDYDQQTQRQVFRGYQASNQVSVTLRDTEEVGEVLDALVQAGATDINGPSFSVADDTAAKAEARKRAMERARAMALDYARVAGYSNVRVLQISESVSGPVREYAADSIRVRAQSAGAPPVQPGMVETGVTVSVTYEAVN